MGEETANKLEKDWENRTSYHLTAFDMRKGRPAKLHMRNTQIPYERLMSMGYATCIVNMIRKQAATDGKERSSSIIYRKVGQTLGQLASEITPSYCFLFILFRHGNLV